MKLRLTERYNKLLRTGLICILSFFGYRSAAQNLIVDGSMNGGIQRSDTVAPGWYKYGPEQPYLNTPDLNGDSGILHCSPGYSWWGGTPVASPDGGTWQNVWRIENFAQTVYGLTVGTTYYFRYYYASQGISDGPPQAPASLPYPPDVTIIGATGYTNPSASKLFEWSTYSGSLVATSDSMTIICSEGKYDGYIAYDGFYLGTTQPDNFLEVKAPDSVTLCGAGDASFSVQSAAGVSYQWQSGFGFIWDDVIDGGGVSGANTNTLLVPNVTAALNKTQYRCRVTSSCCTAISAPARPAGRTISGSCIENKHGRTRYSADWPASSYPQIPFIVIICGMIIQKNKICRSPIRAYTGSKSRTAIIAWERIPSRFMPCEKFVAPNAFTPNGDGINDVFKPILYGPVANYTLTIYNRWGQMIFKSRDPGRGWDGTISGVPQPDDTYVWNCLFQLTGKKPEDKSGTVILIR